MTALPAAEREPLLQLLRSQRWAALATVADGTPEASWVAFVPDEPYAPLLHLSRLAAHTRNLAVNPAASLAIGQPDDGRPDPQTLARVTLFGTVEAVGTEGAEAERRRRLYLARLPEAEPRFAFADFALYRLVPARANYVGGFGRAWRLSGEELRELAAG